MTIDEIKRRNADRGHHFFDRSTMRFFRSRVGKWTVRGEDDRVYFITSEQFDEQSDRRFTIRAMETDGAVNTVGEFQAFADLRTAKRAAVKIARSARSATSAAGSATDSAQEVSE